jgi:XTP/dITP diphosphohydrolase
MKELVVATRNRGKLKELQQLLPELFDTVSCAADIPGFPETIEDGSSFEENALKKAREAMRYSGRPALADDSGLVVDILDGRPGVHSARFAGEGCGDEANNRRLLKELYGVPYGQRQAAFVCALAYVTPDGCEQVFSGRVGGRILEEGRGKDGFGYDPLFLADGFDRTMAELTLDEKNAVSHRGQALRLFRAFLTKDDE